LLLYNHGDCAWLLALPDMLLSPFDLLRGEIATYLRVTEKTCSRDPLCRAASGDQQQRRTPTLLLEVSLATNTDTDHHPRPARILSVTVQGKQTADRGPRFGEANGYTSGGCASDTVLAVWSHVAIVAILSARSRQRRVEMVEE
jgi:hypothetical protein